MINQKYITHQRAPFFEIAKEIIHPQDVVLDVGSGDGGFAVYCNRPDMFMLEGNPDSVKFLKTQFPNVVEGRLPMLPFDNEQFDVIHMSHVIEHLRPEEVYTTLKEFERCCKPGGAIVISAPLLWEGFYDDLSHIKPYSPGILKKYMCEGMVSNSTRSKISYQFKQERLEYRYLQKNRYTAVNESANIFNIFIFKVYQKLKRILFKEYERTGYTIVLRKENH
mgnify:CR=1 FL=1|tara:strand:+ start:1403 stop:2068 length:666 start_codon:yes stop_codon:yes gene_type:complete